jgi:hypothetical protein
LHLLVTSKWAGSHNTSSFPSIFWETAAKLLIISSPPYNPWVLIDGKKVHKATVLRLYSNPFAVSDSKDRLKRVCGFSQYDKSLPASGSSPEIPAAVASDTKNPETVCIQDPAVTLV